MYEICRFIAATTPKVKKARKPSKPRATIGAKVKCYPGGDGVIVSKCTDYRGYWMVQLDDPRAESNPYRYHRDAFDINA